MSTNMAFSLVWSMGAAAGLAIGIVITYPTTTQKERGETMPLTRFEIDFDGSDALDAMPLIAELNSHGLTFEKTCEMSGRARFEGSLSDRGAERAKSFVECHLDEGQKLYATQEGENVR